MFANYTISAIYIGVRMSWLSKIPQIYLTKSADNPKIFFAKSADNPKILNN